MDFSIMFWGDVGHGVVQPRPTPSVELAGAMSGSRRMRNPFTSPSALARIGTGAARRFFVTGERFPADVAWRIGLVHEVADDLDEAIGRIVAEILSAGPEAARVAKRLARAPLSPEETCELIAERRTSAEGQEGLRAFLEKRAAGPAESQWGPFVTP